MVVYCPITDGKARERFHLANWEARMMQVKINYDDVWESYDHIYVKFQLQNSFPYLFKYDMMAEASFITILFALPIIQAWLLFDNLDNHVVQNFSNSSTLLHDCFNPCNWQYRPRKVAQLSREKYPMCCVIKLCMIFKNIYVVTTYCFIFTGASA